LKQAAPSSYNLVWISAVALLVFGMCMLLSVAMASTGQAEEGNQTGNTYSAVGFQGIVAVIGLGLMFALSYLDYRRLRRASVLLLVVVGVSLLLVHVPGIGHRVNGATSYIGRDPVSYQPSEFAKLAVVLAGAHLMSTSRTKDGKLRSFLLPVGAVGLALCGLVALENDFGSATIIAGLLLGMLWIAGMRGKHWLLLTGGGAIGGAGLMLLLGREKVTRRLLAWTDPWADAGDKGYQLCQSLLALGRGGWFGVGPGRSVQKFNYLPEAHNDMIFAIVGEEFGFVGAALVITLFAVFAVACWRLARRCADPMGKYLIAGCGMIITLQAAVNIGGVVGAIPLTGVPLPFVSHGCNSLLVMLIAVGIVLGVARHASALPATSPARRYENVTRIDCRRWDGGARSARSGAS
jgi:cell division protein FtsW